MPEPQRQPTRESWTINQILGYAPLRHLDWWGNPRTLKIRLSLKREFKKRWGDDPPAYRPLDKPAKHLFISFLKEKLRGE